MILTTLLPTDFCFRDLDKTLSLIHREVRFIARTLARLRHRHHAAIVFSNKQLPHHKATADLHSRLSETSLEMWKRLFRLPKKGELPLDVESAPASPMTERPPSCIVPVDQACVTPAASAGSAASYFAHTPPLTPNNEDIVYVTVDERMPTTFAIPRSRMPPCTTKASGSTNTQRSGDVSETVSLHKVSTTQFFDYLQWRKTGRILQYSHNNVEYAIEHYAQTLVSALSCGVLLEDLSYQRAAMQEFLALAPLLCWAEDYVNNIFAATTTETEDVVHPARKMIVAVIAANTCGSGKRKVRHGPREKGVMRGDRIETGTFWGLYDAYCARNGPECGWPETVEEFIGR